MLDNASKPGLAIRMLELMFWLSMLGAPLSILVFGDRMLEVVGGPALSFYRNTANVLGDVAARVIIGLPWLALASAIFWRYVISKHRHEDPGPPADLHD
jgi:hypothetical protein